MKDWFRVFTLRDGSKREIRIEDWRSLQGEMKKLGIIESDIFQIQMVEKEVPQYNKKRY
ncbi:hypothetical protein [Priestia megaterium]|uniref:hypothetical protein n=1 Tax=Priestia megaterium TaxID=1404 RepID=UPI0025A3FF43|nr:hypothetical protein [Priestia megaterium]MDM8148513.1 hypothetical protein [Priestia megaterium]